MSDILDPTKHKAKTAERLELAITALDLKQRDVAKNCSVSETALSNYLRGAHYPSHYFLYRFAERYPITIDYLLAGSLKGIDASLGDALRAAELASSAGAGEVERHLPEKSKA